MTTTTAPITLPGRHRQEAPVWAFHILVAWLTYWLQLAAWTVVRFVRTEDRRHLAAFVAGLVLVAAAPLILTAVP